MQTTAAAADTVFRGRNDAPALTCWAGRNQTTDENDNPSTMYRPPKDTGISISQLVELLGGDDDGVLASQGHQAAVVIPEGILHAGNLTQSGSGNQERKVDEGRDESRVSGTKSRG